MDLPTHGGQSAAQALDLILELLVRGGCHSAGPFPGGLSDGFETPRQYSAAGVPFNGAVGAEGLIPGPGRR